LLSCRWIWAPHPNSIAGVTYIIPARQPAGRRGYVLRVPNADLLKGAPHTGALLAHENVHHQKQILRSMDQDIVRSTDTYPGVQETLLARHSSIMFRSSRYWLTYGPELFLRSRQLCSYSRTSQHFMEPEGSFPCSHEPSTGPYPEPDRSSP
jgi:hypothetical protein